MQSTYDEALRRLLIHEGGYSNHPSDPGGPTNFGITIADYRRYVKTGANAADVRAMTVDEAKAIYRARYAQPLRYDDLPAGVDYAVFDYGVNSGIGRAAKVLQRLCDVADDGKTGKDTLAAVARRDPRSLIEAICRERLVFLQSLRTWPVFGNGWGRRVLEVRAAALVMASGAGPVPNPTPRVPGKGHVTPSRGPLWAAGGSIVAASIALRDVVAAHPIEALVLGGVTIGAIALAVRAWHRATFNQRQESPAVAIAPVPASQGASS